MNNPLYFFISNFNGLIYLQIFICVCSLILYIFLIDFYLSNLGKIEENQVTTFKRNAFFVFIGFSILFFFTEIYFLPKIISFKLSFFESILFIVVAVGGFFCAAWGGSQLVGGKHIKLEKKKIEKKQTADGFGTLLDAVQPTKEVGTPLISYVYDENEHLEALRVTNEDRGIVLGVPGAGKTAYLVMQIIDWMRSGQSFVATDIKPEIWAILKYNGMFEKYGYKDYVFNPTDVNSDHYNIFSEVQDSSEFNEVLNIIIADTDSADAKVFNDNARRLLKAILIELGAKASLPNAQEFINSMDDNAELLKTLRQSNNETVSSIAKDITRTAKSDNLLASIMTAVSKAFDFLDDERIRKTISENAEGFYLKDVLMKPKQAVFLQFDQQYKSSTATLFGAMVAHTMRILQANQNRGAVFIALDEIINCAPIPKFTDLLNTIRSANMPTFLYLQSLEGLNRLYGLNADRLFLGASNYKITFRIDDNSTAEEFSKLIGKTETTYFTYSENNNDGASSSKNGGSRTQSKSSGYSESTKLEYIIEQDELIKLDKHHAVIIYNGKFAILEMKKYWELFNCPVRIKKASPSDWLEHKKNTL